MSVLCLSDWKNTITKLIEFRANHRKLTKVTIMKMWREKQWLFHKLQQGDIFVDLDRVQFPKNEEIRTIELVYAKVVSLNQFMSYEQPFNNYCYSG
jgi:hypothetical protein